MTDRRLHTTLCENCAWPDPDLKYHKATDEYWCDSCFDAEYDEAMAQREVLNDEPESEQ